MTDTKKIYRYWKGIDAFRNETGGRPVWYKPSWSSAWIKCSWQVPKDTEIVAFKFPGDKVWDITEGWQ